MDPVTGFAHVVDWKSSPQVVAAHLDIEGVDFYVHRWERNASCRGGWRSEGGLQLCVKHKLQAAAGRRGVMVQTKGHRRTVVVVLVVVHGHRGWCRRARGRWQLQAGRALVATMEYTDPTLGSRCIA